MGVEWRPLLAVGGELGVNLGARGRLQVDVDLCADDDVGTPYLPTDLSFDVGRLRGESRQPAIAVPRDSLGRLDPLGCLP